MSVQSEVSRLNAAKSDLASAITAKGVTVPGTTKLDGYAALVEQIEAGGVSSAISRINLAESWLTPDNNNAVTFFSDDGSIYMVANGSLLMLRVDQTKLNFATKNYVDQMIGEVENGSY